VKRGESLEANSGKREKLAQNEALRASPRGDAILKRQINKIVF